ncbi:hypothetical protein ACIOHR_37600 [Streptomyces anulatus]
MTMDQGRLEERWRSFSGPANIYEVDMAVDPLDDIIGLARQAGLDRAADATAWHEAGPLLEVEQEPYVCTVYRPSRAVQVVDTSRWQVDDGANLEISDAEATEAATREAERLGLFGDDAFAPFRVTRLHVASAERGRPAGDERVIDVGVVFTRRLDGLSFEGQGGNIVMYLGSDGRLTGFERVSRRIAGVREAVGDWRGLEEVLSEVEGYWRLRRGEGLDVEDARLGYLELGRLQEQEVIQPVYVLGLRLAGGGSGSAPPDADRRIEHVVPAATNRVGTLMPVAEYPSPAPGRRHSAD